MGNDSEGGEPDIVIGPREQLFHLIAEASEIEHTLMCSYLYAAFSLKQGTDTGLSEVEADAVARWRKSILAVAIDEMVHLVLVSNLSIALGGRPHLRDMESKRMRPSERYGARRRPKSVTASFAPCSEATPSTIGDECTPLRRNCGAVSCKPMKGRAGFLHPEAM
jgi:hypothetical protein